MKELQIIFVKIVMCVCVALCEKSLNTNFKQLIGPLNNLEYGIKGTVFVLNENTILIKGFEYDGNATTTFFLIGNSSIPTLNDSITVPYPGGLDYRSQLPAEQYPVLHTHNHTDILLRLSSFVKSIKDIRWLAVWDILEDSPFSTVFFPPGLKFPRVLPEFKRLAHDLRSGNITILDEKTFYVPNLYYDGKAPDPYFFVGSGTEPGPKGIKVPNELCSLDHLERYQGENITIQLPGTLKVYDIDWLAVWCVEYNHNFGHVLIPKDLDVPPSTKTICPETQVSREENKSSGTPKADKNSGTPKENKSSGTPKLTLSFIIIIILFLALFIPTS